MTMQVGGSNGLVFPDNSTQNTAATGFGFKNRIINGAMMIDQRNSGASVTVPNTNVTATWSVDRWRMISTQASKFSVQQNAGSVTPPNGFTNYLGTTSASAYSVLTNDVFGVGQLIEGYNVADFGWGTANAAAVTLSFWVRSSLTGTFGGVFRNSIGTRSYPFSYTVNAANTWEQKSITVSGDTSGTWLTTNGAGITVYFGMGAGSTYSATAGAWAAGDYYSATGATSVVGTNGATFYITGVQLEKGSTATSFDYRPYGTELALCQRYYQILGGTASSLWIGGYAASSTTHGQTISYSQMRANPTASIVGTWGVVNTPSAPSVAGLNVNSCLFYTVPTSGGSYYTTYNNANAGILLSSEL